MKNFRITVAFAAVILGMPLLPVLAQNPSEPQKKMEMGGGMMGMMDECKKECDAVSATMADVTKTIADVKASNDVAKLHAALDHVQAGMAKMDARMKACDANMKKMDSMKMDTMKKKD